MDLRRSISSTYYALFHKLCTALADNLIGFTERQTPLYALVYRGLDHGSVKRVCREIAKQTPPAKYKIYVPSDGLGKHIATVAKITADLQDLRHKADYDPLESFSVSGANLAIDQAEEAMARLDGARRDQRRIFLTLLLLEPRS